MENEKDYVRVLLPARSRNNGGNKMKLKTRIGSNRAVERESSKVGNVLLFKITREGNRARAKWKEARAAKSSLFRFFFYRQTRYYLRDERGE